MSDWVLEGKSVNAAYCGAPVVGTVLNSRVTYGGMVSHYIRTTEDFTLSGQLRVKGEGIIVDDKYVSAINGSPYTSFTIS
jgi:hypothetical protein|tara:strand:+ start:38570 stop:38809 length:240 start_codon:yes stop_codon:yes gene_type:complete